MLFPIVFPFIMLFEASIHITKAHRPIIRISPKGKSPVMGAFQSIPSFTGCFPHILLLYAVCIYIYMHPHHIRINNRKSSYMTTWYVTPNKNNKIMYHYFGWIFWNLSFWRLLCLLTNTNQSHHVKSPLNRHHISIFSPWNLIEEL